MIDVVSLFFLMFLAYPPVDSDEFCDWYHEEKPSTLQAFRVMENEINKNSNIRYFVSHFPDVSYKNGIVEESFPGHYYSFYTFGNDTMSTRFDFYFHPCGYEPRISEYYYGDDPTEIRIDHTSKTRDGYLALDSTQVFEIVHDIALHKTHEKWLNLNSETIYILPKSSPTLVERGYLTEQRKFFEHEEDHPLDSGVLYENNTHITSQKHEPQIQSVEVIIPRGAVIEENPYLIPEEVTVVLGVNNTVTWINQDDTYHSFSSDSRENLWSTGGLKPGESSSVTFTETGIYKYHGEPGPWRTGTVIVLEE